jgi:HD-GYP domain-containing protein (c-di-GMP phosphodiesterase class II)
MSQYLDKIDIFAILIAGLGHDLGHPGVNNSYFTKTNSIYAKAVND